mgnify:CR=1 FL=1
MTHWISWLLPLAFVLGAGIWLGPMLYAVLAVVGAVGGAVAGHQVEKQVRADKLSQITVRLEDGSLRTVDQEGSSRWQVGDHVRLSAGQGTRALLLAGQPLREPIVQYGPFVMNTKEEIYQALADFRDGRLGEKA